jgi:hypothetical protein
MAELLILKRKHWAEDAKPVGWTPLKWASSPKRGDIVEVQKDGFYRIESLGTGTHGWDRDAYALIITKDSSKESIAYLSQPFTDQRETEFNVITTATKAYVHRYCVSVDDIAWTKNKVSVSKKQFEEWYFVCDNLDKITTTDKVNG